MYKVLTSLVYYNGNSYIENYKQEMGGILAIGISPFMQWILGWL